MHVEAVQPDENTYRASNNIYDIYMKPANTCRNVYETSI